MKNLSLVVLLMACVSRQANAADDPHQMFEAATAEFNLGHYEKAASMYEDIYKLTLDPVLLYNIAQARRLGGDFEKAVFFYKGYLRAQPQARNRGEVQKRIAELDQAIAAKRRSQERPPNVPAAVEPRASATAPSEAAPSPNPPPAAETTPSTSPPNASSSTPPAAQAEPQPSAPATTAANEPTPSSERPVWKKWWFWTIIGGVVVAGIVVGVAVAATESPSFGANLPESGPAAHALTLPPSSHPQALPSLEVRF